MASHSEPVVCTLTSKQAGSQLTEWSDLRHRATSVAALPDGVKILFPSVYTDDARDLAAREIQCCAFLEIELVEHGESTQMTIISPNPDGVPVVHALAGLTDA